MAAIEGVSLHLWSSSSSCSLVFPSPTSSVVETLLSVLGNHRGVGQASSLLLQEARGLAMDSPGAWQQIEGAAVRVEAVQNIWVNKGDGQGEEKGSKNNFEEPDEVKNYVKRRKRKTKDRSALKEGTFIIKKVIDPIQNQKVEVKEEEEIVAKIEPLDELDLLEVIVKEDNIKEEKYKINEEQKKAEEGRFRIKEDNHKITTFCKICEPKRLVKAGRVHMRTVHTVSSLHVLPCPKCWEWFSTKEALEYHLTCHGKDPKYLVCTVCKYKLFSQTYRKRRIKNIRCGQHTLDEHMKIHLEEGKFRIKEENRKITIFCKICEPKRKVEAGRVHMRTVHTVSSLHVLPCPKCWEWFSTKEALEYHLTCHGRDPKYLVCTICKYKLLAQTYKKRRTKNIRCGQHTFDEHMKIHLEKYNCDQCGKLFLDSKRLKAHRQYHKEKDQQCHMCERMFRNQFRVNEHIAVKHESNMDQECDKCHRKYPTQYRLNEHIKGVHGPKQFMCEICFKGFKTKPHLNMHSIQVHIAEYPYKCHSEGCSKKFKTSTKQRFHARSHTGDKPYKCEKCEAAFLRSDNLKKHMMTHTGETPFRCLKCGKGFIQSSNRKSHSEKCTLNITSHSLST